MLRVRTLRKTDSTVSGTILRVRPGYAGRDRSRSFFIIFSTRTGSGKPFSIPSMNVRNNKYTVDYITDTDNETHTRCGGTEMNKMVKMVSAETVVRAEETESVEEMEKELDSFRKGLAIAFAVVMVLICA